jgi:transcriptional regulatory protein LEU3
MQFDTASTSGLVDVYGIAVRMIERFSALNVTTNIAAHSTFYLYRTLGLAAFVILKLYRSPMELVIDRERGERCYFLAVQLLRRRSVQEVDLDSKLATILTELWSSSLVFRTREGLVNSLPVRVKSRLVGPQCTFPDEKFNNSNRR